MLEKVKDIITRTLALASIIVIIWATIYMFVPPTKEEKELEAIQRIQKATNTVEQLIWKLEQQATIIQESYATLQSLWDNRYYSKYKIEIQNWTYLITKNNYEGN